MAQTSDSKMCTSHSAHKGPIYVPYCSIGPVVDYHPQAALQVDTEQPYLHLFPELSSNSSNQNHSRSRSSEPTVPSKQSLLSGDLSIMPRSSHANSARNSQYTECWCPNAGDISEHDGSSSNSHSEYEEDDYNPSHHNNTDATDTSEPAEYSTTKSGTKPFTRTSKAGNKHFVTPAGASILKCTFVENGQPCTADTFNLPSKIRAHLIEKHMEFSPFQCGNCMRVFTRLSLRTRHLEKLEVGSTLRICPHQTSQRGGDFEARQRVEEALWNIRLEQTEVNNAIQLIKQYNGQLEARRRRGQSTDRSPRGSGPPSPQSREYRLPSGVRKTDHRRTRSTSSPDQTRHSHQFLASAHPAQYQSSQISVRPNHPSQQQLQPHPPQYSQGWSESVNYQFCDPTSQSSSSGAYYPRNV
ncbi:hypothetical protein BDD12DRAFT_302525 [Trichophaea hybrida]|nr:hypothetical protein BDD12DRAFT_302525 [Trichophaea hybrida]